MKFARLKDLLRQIGSQSHVNNSPCEFAKGNGICSHEEYRELGVFLLSTVHILFIAKLFGIVVPNWKALPLRSMLSQDTLAILASFIMS